MAKITKISEQTTIALMGQDIGYIKNSILEIQNSIKSIDTNFVKKEDLKDVTTEISDHETRIRFMERYIWLAVGALTVITFALNYLK